MGFTGEFSVCVYCGSRYGDDQDFAAGAFSIGRGLAKRGMRLVYGAGDVGLMGQVARAAQEHGGYTLGVIPKHLQDREVAMPNLSAYVVTENMHERKKIMFMNADAVIALPGGPGTLDELFEVLTWRQLGLHDKPVILANLKGYWDPLLVLIDHQIAHGFASASFRDFLTVRDSAASALDALDELRLR